MPRGSQLRVLHVLWSPEVGGIERVVHDLAVEQSRDETLSVAVLFGKAGGGFRDMFEATELELHDANFRHGVHVLSRTMRRTRRLMCEFDIIHLHAFDLPLAVAAAASGRSVVYTEHGNFGFGRVHTMRDAVKHLFQR